MGFGVPDLGIFFPRTSHRPRVLATGARQTWSRAIREGVDPDGRELAPVMAFRSYAGLTDADAADLVAFLKSLPPISRSVPWPVRPE
jgi:hypothetical protein